VVVVDNGSSDNTWHVCESFSDKLNLGLVVEKRVGIPYARNKGIAFAKGDVLAFIDDDCLANKKWLKSIFKHFSKYNEGVGVLGKSFPLSKTNRYQMVEYVYYLRWLRYNVKNVNATSLINNGVVVDFKNAAFLRKFVDKFQFSARVPFGDVGNEDVEVGVRLFESNKKIYFDPSIQVSHEYSSSLVRLIARNFWQGYSDQILKNNFAIDLKISSDEKSIRDWMYDLKELLKKLRISDKVLFLLLVLIYPLFSRLGRSSANISNLLKLEVKMPARA
jgi:glycosyltransferase involved in cell wall biosynthesis